MANLNSIYNKVNSERVETVIADFEKSIDFEFIPVISEKSSYIDHVSWIISLLFCILSVGLIDWIFASLLQDSWVLKEPFFFAIPFIAYLFGFFLGKVSPLQRFFISRRERTRQVHEKAELIFYKNRLHEIKSSNALMLYISVMERQIVLLPDPKMQFKDIKAVNEDLLKILQKSFKKSDFEEGLIAAINHLKVSLLPHFKKTEETENNFSNKLIWWRD